MVGRIRGTITSESRNSVDIKFVIRAWAAWAPGLHDSAQWLAWAEAPAARPPGGVGEPAAVSAMPALARRRLSPLGRSAAQVIYQLAAEVAPGQAGLPMLLASRYGDTGRSLALLDDLARSEAVSPTAFSLSVHNAIGAVVAIARGDRSPQTALSAGACSAGHALIEAAGWLADGTPELILVCYDEPLPGDYAVFGDEPPAPYAWAWRIAAPGGGEAGVELRLKPQDAAVTADPRWELPFGLALLRFVLSGRDQWERIQEGQHWCWRRDA